MDVGRRWWWRERNVIVLIPREGEERSAGKPSIDSRQSYENGKTGERREWEWIHKPIVG